MLVEDAIIADGKTIIVGDPLLTDVARYYSKRPGLYVMYQSDDSNHVLCQYFESVCRTPESLRSHARELAGLYPSTTLLAEMSRAGFQATIRMTNPTVVYFSPR
jgi:hypothetical protein